MKKFAKISLMVFVVAATLTLPVRGMIAGSEGRSYWNPLLLIETQESVAARTAGMVDLLAQQKPKPKPTPDILRPCDCIADPCCYSPVAQCPTCCNGVPCRRLSDAQMKKFPGKSKYLKLTRSSCPARRG